MHFQCESVGVIKWYIAYAIIIVDPPPPFFSLFWFHEIEYVAYVLVHGDNIHEHYQRLLTSISTVYCRYLYNI